MLTQTHLCKYLKERIMEPTDLRYNYPSLSGGGGVGTGFSLHMDDKIYRGKMAWHLHIINADPPAIHRLTILNNLSSVFVLLY